MIFQSFWGLDRLVERPEREEIRIPKGMKRSQTCMEGWVVRMKIYWNIKISSIRFEEGFEGEERQKQTI